ncbi:hypothetical protein BD309DRAFT_945230 [Dichomitus squalens]|uniref:Uncharacterized protein n=1 Tax=Dichomitus squalens TaxID=114155 RepID=A0A4Q9Q2C6_9APHY|nr:hypothetical protein BD309DRAFT_945230 [Dichomitus squalens]TBU61265.1 hypothetical protein BD310DRAFT_1037243 [Dichomitus squalens]
MEDHRRAAGKRPQEPVLLYARFLPQNPAVPGSRYTQILAPSEHFTQRDRFHRPLRSRNLSPLGSEMSIPISPSRHPTCPTDPPTQLPIDTCVRILPLQLSVPQRHQRLRGDRQPQGRYIPRDGPSFIENHPRRTPPTRTERQSPTGLGPLSDCIQPSDLLTVRGQLRYETLALVPVNLRAWRGQPDRFAGVAAELYACSIPTSRYLSDAIHYPLMRRSTHSERSGRRLSA